jgi:hypothetical protein
MLPRSWIVMMIAIAALLLVAVFSYRNYRSTAVPLYSPKGISNAQTNPEIPLVSKLARPQGSPALKADMTAVPGFTLDDVKRYVGTHPVRTSDARPRTYTITRAEFMNSKQVSDLLSGARTGFPEDYMLCYVELAGTFTFSGPRGATRIYQRGFEVFDAHTGNLLMVGGLRN